jgi:predicted O-methyltransferase YrrM
MNNIPQLLQDLEKEMRQDPVTYPDKLLAKIDRTTAFGREHSDYIVRGGEAGAYFHWLTLLMQKGQPKRCVELGNRYGLSTLAMYHTLPQNTPLYTVDMVKDLRLVPEFVFQDSRMHFIFGDSRDLSLYEPLPIDIDFWWSDTVHNDAQLRSEFHVWEPLLADEALIAIDDINLNDKRKFFDESPHAKWDLTKLCHVSGFGAIHYQRPASEQGKDPAARRAEALRRSAQAGYAQAAVYMKRVAELESSIYEVWKGKFERRIGRLWKKSA